MSVQDSQIEGSYNRHAEHEAQVVLEERLPSCFSNVDSVDAWRHRRMHASVLPLVRACPQASWLTIGDGNYGSDAYFLSQEGADVVASSLTESSLLAAKKLGYLSHVASVNAENIQFPDNSFDFVLCKEAYHHFPRPAIAFYEMLRVARIGVVLIEPLDGQGRALSWLKVTLKRILRGKTNIENFEKTGNFIYRVNQAEMEKMLTSLNYRSLAIRRFNDCYLSWASSSTFKPKSWGFGVTAAGIALQTLLCRLRLLDYGLATVICFKSYLKPEIRRELLASSYEVRDLPKNPFISVS